MNPPALHPSHDADEAAITAVAVFAFDWPDLAQRGEDIRCYNLTRDIPGHPKNSTVSRGTILQALGRQSP